MQVQLHSRAVGVGYCILQLLLTIVLDQMRYTRVKNKKKKTKKNTKKQIQITGVGFKDINLNSQCSKNQSGRERAD